ncbi:MAG: DUF1501 domain-containing protein [Pseudomonadota bacterium]
MNRRDFIKLGGLAALPLVGPKLAFGSNSATSGRDVLVVVFQRGGADGLNIVAPWADGRYRDLRPTIAVPEPGAPGGVIDIDGYFGFHPSLAPLLPAWEAGELAVVHAAGSPDDTRSHFDAQDYMDRGAIGKGSVFDGWLNRHVSGVPLESVQPFTAVGVGNSLPLSLQGSAPAIGIDSIDGFDLVAPGRAYEPLRKTLGDLYGGASALDAQASQVFSAVDVLQDALGGVAETEAAFPQSAFGQQLAAVASLIRADIGLEVATVDIGGWDHHDQENAELPGLLEDFAASLAAFRDDLGADMGRVTVVTMTEFGRRAAENASAGTDHGHASVMFALGQGVNGGQIHGEWPGLENSALNRGDLEVTTDFRTVLADVLQQRRGTANVAALFPDFAGPTSAGLFLPR